MLYRNKKDHWMEILDLVLTLSDNVRKTIVAADDSWRRGRASAVEFNL